MDVFTHIACNVYFVKQNWLIINFTKMLYFKFKCMHKYFEDLVL